MTISTRNLADLPEPKAFRRLTRSLAMLDAILSPEWEYRYYSFNSKWGDGELMASMRNGQGDHWFALFASGGVALHGLSHEATMYRPDNPWPGIFEAVPREFESFVTEPAFDTRNSTFCLWRRWTDSAWHRGDIAFPSGDDPDGSKYLLWLLDGDPSKYVEFAHSYYEVDLSPEYVQALYRHDKLTEEVVKGLNPDLLFDQLKKDIEEIGYPEAAG